MSSFKERLASYIFDLEDVPISIHRVWKDFKDTRDKDTSYGEKISFVKMFHQLDKEYDMFKIVYYKGVPYILYTKKDIWQFTNDKFVADESDEIIDNDIVQFYVQNEEAKGTGEECDEDLQVNKSFISRLIDSRQLYHLKLLMKCYDFNEDELDEFLHLAIEKQNQKDEENQTEEERMLSRHYTTEILLLLMKKKYDSSLNYYIQKKNQFESEYDKTKMKYDELRKEYNLLTQDYEFLKNFFYTFCFSLVLFRWLL